MKIKCTPYLLLLISVLTYTSCTSQRLMENLDRGVIVIPQEDQSAVISWRVLGTDPYELNFNLYRQSGDEMPQQLNTKPISGSTFFIDTNADWFKKNTW